MGAIWVRFAENNKITVKIQTISKIFVGSKSRTESLGCHQKKWHLWKRSDWSVWNVRMAHQRKSGNVVSPIVLFTHLDWEKGQSRITECLFFQILLQKSKSFYQEFMKVVSIHAIVETLIKTIAFMQQEIQLGGLLKLWRAALTKTVPLA